MLCDPAHVPATTLTVVLAAILTVILAVILAGTFCEDSWRKSGVRLINVLSKPAKSPQAPSQETSGHTAKGLAAKGQKKRASERGAFLYVR